MTALVTSVVVEQPLRSAVRGLPSRRRARPFPAPALQRVAQRYAFFAFLCGFLLFRINKPANTHRAKSRGGGLICAHLRATRLHLTSR